MNPALLSEYGPALLRGFGVTIALSAAILLAATPVAAALALMRRSPRRALSWTAATYVNALRVVPVLLVLFFTFYALPQLGLPLSPFTAAFVGMTLVGAAYMSEDIRAGFSAVDPGQWRAAEALGLPYGRTLRRIVLPQALPLIAPPYASRAIIIVKGTSLASLVAVGDLTGEAVRATSITYQPFVFLLIAGALYLLLAGGLVLLQSWAERRFAIGRPRAVPA